MDLYVKYDLDRDLAAYLLLGEFYRDCHHLRGTFIVFLGGNGLRIHSLLGSFLGELHERIVYKLLLFFLFSRFLSGFLLFGLFLQSYSDTRFYIGLL